MLLLRLSLEGFMSYRDRTEFDFSGARLWMLCGPNGAGKSSVFDALRFVLYGTHRAGKQNAEALVHHESTRLCVEADLALGDAVYRLVRTLGRDGARPTWAIKRREGASWSDVPETASKGDYERWVAHNVGLSDEAFCAAVYLSQGKADAILSPDPEARYALLCQLVDLRVYEGWHARAEERRILARARALEARKKWEVAPLPDEDGLRASRQAHEALGRERVLLEARERELSTLGHDAARWETWKAELEALSRRAHEGRALLAHADVIERAVARLAFLERNHPALQTLHDLVEAQAQAQAHLALLRPQLDAAQREADEARAARARTQARLEQAQRARSAAQETLLRLEIERAQLAPGEAELERRRDLRDRRADLSQRLARSADADISVEERERDAARETARTLPLWRRFVHARETLRTAQATLSKSEQTLAHLEAREATLQREHSADEEALERAQHEAHLLAQAQTSARLRLEAAQSARSDFARVESEGRCFFCGQELSPEHREREHARLQNEEEHALREHALAVQAHQKASATFEDAKARRHETHRRVGACAREVQATRLARALEGERAESARALAGAAWNELGHARAEAGCQDDFEAALRGSLPDEDVLAQWQAIAATLADRERALANAQKAQRERDEALRALEAAERDLAPLEEKWSEDAARAWHARWASLCADLAVAEGAVLQAQREAADAADEVGAREHHERACAGRCAQLRQLLEPLEKDELARAGQIALLWEGVRALLPGEDEPALARLRAVNEAWTQEARALASDRVRERAGELQQVRASLSSLASEAGFLVRAIEGLPILARQPRRALDEQHRSAATRLQEVREESQRLEAQIARWEREEQERARFEAEMAQSEREHERWSELARLLGPRQLQRHLLRGAERAIVREANAVLESISGGTLRLELRAEDDEAGSRVPKVLDVLCHHLSGGETSRPIAPAFLSGSQRFRVAVALALGIGRTMARGAGTAPSHGARVEAILIDEGFGSLDKTGRDEMKDELRALSRELGRIILVSHQDDFAQSFPARFNIELDAGVSRAQMVVE